MKLYNRSLTRKKFDHERRWNITDRDAVVWSVDTGNFYCLVKIQGSDTTIKAHYPRNWKTTPTWLKPGNAVQIRHRSGAQGFVEVTGHGRAIPTPVEGGNLPTPGTSGDGIVTGMEIVEYSGGGMNVVVNSGTFRINDVIYVYTMAVTGYIVMDDPAPMTMGVGIKMGYGDTVTPIVIGAAPAAGYGRYDAIVVGTDSVIDVVEGSPTLLTTEPTKPAVPAGHLLVGYLFIYGGMTAIPQGAIGTTWASPYPGLVYATSGSGITKQSDGSFWVDWSTIEDTPVGSLTFTIKDQYGNNKVISVDATITMLSGTGGVGTSAGGSFSSSATKLCTSSVTFYYERNQLASPEIPVGFKVTFDTYGALSFMSVLVMLDSGGDPL